jgi:hypothetical protein
MKALIIEKMLCYMVDIILKLPRCKHNKKEPSKGVNNVYNHNLQCSNFHKRNIS